jgi:methyl-accepting chemotaxis protein
MRTIAARQILAITGVGIVAALAVGMTLGWMQNRAATRAFDDNASSILSLIQKSSVNSYANFEYGTLEDLAKTLLGDKNVISVLFADEKGKGVAKAAREGASDVGPQALTRSAEVRSADGALLGSVAIRLSRASLDREQKKNWVALFIICIFSVVASLLIGVIVSRTITRPLLRATNMLKDISEGEGDLTSRLDASSRDEIGDLGRYFNKFVEKLQGVVGRVADNADTVAASATELSATSSQIAGSAQQMTSQTASVASAAELATTTINAISSAAKEMSDLANAVSVSIGQMSASLSKVASSCQKELMVSADASNHVRSSKEIMSRLDNVSHSIGKVVEVINSIAEQTNLLALNATIEAASAGEAGKGFSVVANEIKELARQTALSTHTIEKQISDVQENTQSAVEAIDAVSKVIEEVNQISQTIVRAVEEQNAAANEISKNVGGVSSGAQEVARNVEKSARGLAEVASSIGGVNVAVADTSRSISQIQTSAEELAKLSESLKGLVNQFKV